MEDKSFSLQLKDLVEKFLATQGPDGQGKVIFCALTGTRSNNLISDHREGITTFESIVKEDECEIYGVYAVPTEGLLGIAGMDMNVKERTLLTPPGSKPSIRVDEVAKFSNLCVEANPNCLELLYAEHYCYQSEEWIELKKFRERLVTKQVLTKFVNHARNYLVSRGKAQKRKEKYIRRLDTALLQKEKLEKEKEAKKDKHEEDEKQKEKEKEIANEEKNMRAEIAKHDKQEAAPNHEFFLFFRFLYQAERLLKGEQVKVWLEDDSEERRELLGVMEGKVTKEEAIKRMEVLEKRLTPAVKSSAFPFNCDKGYLNPWLVAVRKNAKYFTLE